MGSEIWLSSRRQLIPCCTDKTSSLVVGDVQRRDGSIRPLIEVSRARGMPPVRCALSKASTKALEKWITASGKKRTDYLFPGRGIEGRHPMGQRQLNRLLKLWVVEAGLDPSDYSVEFLLRTKALHILKGTGDLQTVRALLGHAELRAQRDFSVSKQRPTQSRSVGPSISDAVGAHRFPTDWRLTVRRVGLEKRVSLVRSRNGLWAVVRPRGAEGPQHFQYPTTCCAATHRGFVP